MYRRLMETFTSDSFHQALVSEVRKVQDDLGAAVDMCKP